MALKKWILGFLLVIFLALSPSAYSQCSICSRTVEQMGEKPARGLNAGILYLAFAPLAIIGFIAFKWWKRNRNYDV